MVSEELQKKIDQSIKLLQTIAKGYDGVFEVAYSGGKDSDVILQLAKESGIKFKAIYKNTTIDPKGTIGHAREVGADVIYPINGMNFFKLIEKKGLPNRFHRFCCSELKEYKVLDKAIIGVRKAESRSRNERYNEPTQCRWYGSKKNDENHVEQIFPILEWTDKDVEEFILDRGIKCAPLYYDGNEFHVERRLGCMCCPLKSERKRIEEFKKYPFMVKAYIKAIKKYLDSHPDSKMSKEHNGNPYRMFFRDVFIHSKEQWDNQTNNIFGEIDYKSFLEDTFNIEL